MPFDAREFISMPPVALTEAADLAHTDTKSAWFDMQGYEGAVIMVAVGALTGVDGSNYLTPTLQECNTTADTSATSVAAADMKGPGFSKIDSISEDSLVQAVTYIGSKRYVGVLLDYTGTGISAGIVGVYAFGVKPTDRPDTTNAAVART